MPTGDTNELDFGLTMRGAAKEQKLFGRYTLKRVLGRGGMGIVWLAHDDELNRYVAMKFLPDMLVRDREAVEDLKRETRRSLDLTHHHIVRIYDFTQDDMVAAIIMEYVDGETLSAMKTQQPGGCFGVSVLAPWVAHFTSALDYAHRQARVVHRDLKPANLMVNSRGDLKITDFGISRSMSDSMTRVSVSNTAGTLAYMSPEQALGAPPAPHDDIYALGATIYDLLTGRPPFFRGNLQVQLETVTPPKMADRRTELGNSAEPIPELWETVVAQCLAKRPQDRPETVGEVAALLGLGGMSSHFRPSFSTGTGTTSGTTLTRVGGLEDSATDTNFAPVTPRTSTPPSGGPTSIPRPTSLVDILAQSDSNREPAPPRAFTAPPTVSPAGPTMPAEDATMPRAELSPPLPTQRPPSVEAEVPSAPPSSKAPPLPPPVSPPVPAAPIEEAGKADASSESAVSASSALAADHSTSTSAPAETNTSATSVSPFETSTPSFERPRRSGPNLAIAGIGLLGLVAVVGAWMYLRPSGGDVTSKQASPDPAQPLPVVAAIVPVSPTPTPAPNFDTQVAEIRTLIATERLDEAAAGLEKIPADYSGTSELRSSITSKRAEKAEREKMQMALVRRQETVATYLKASDTAVERSDWPAARSAIDEVRKVDPENPVIASKVKAIDDAEQAEKSMLAEREAKARADREMAAAKARADADAAEEREKQREIAAKAAATDPAPAKKTTATKTSPKKPAPKPVRTANVDTDDDPPPRRQTRSAETSQRPPPPPQLIPKKESTSTAPPPSRTRSNTFRGGAPGG